MKGLPFVLLFTAMTFIAWGAYGPVLHHGTDSMGRDSLRAFVGVGIAYFVIAVLVPIYILRSQGETGKWTMLGTFYSLIAGGVGAIGALGVILALAYGGKTIYVMPLVFGFAPIVNTLVTAWLSRTFNQISPIFIGGIVVAALGAGGVIIFKPAPPAHAQHAPIDTHHDDKDDKQDEGDSKKDGNKASVRFFERTEFFVTTLIPQESKGNAAQEADALPPVVIQPLAPGQQPSSDQSQPAPAVTTGTTATIALERTGEGSAVAVTQEAANQIVSGPDDLPPVVIQPPAPTVQPVQTAVPEFKPAPPERPADVPATEQPTVAVIPEELPPVVVQPEAPKLAPAPPKTAVAPEVEPNKPAEATPISPSTVEQPVPPDNKATQTKVVAPAISKSEVEKIPEQQDKQQTTAPIEKDSQSEKPAPQRIAEVIPPNETKNSPASNRVESGTKDATPATPVVKTAPTPDVPMIIVSIIVAAICWGSYGPMLHQGQSRMGGSRLRPFTCVGLAYFFIAVAAPLALISNRAADTGSWSAAGLSWSIAAGAAGAIGALGVILAFNAGGKPYYVMPLVFGFAPVINTFISLTEAGTWNLVQPMFWVSLAVVIAGAITVLINAPKPQHGKPHATPQTAPVAGQ